VARRLGRYSALPFPFWAALAGGIAVSGEAFLLNPTWINGSEPLLAALGAAFLAVAAAAALASLDRERWSLGLAGGLVARGSQSPRSTTDTPRSARSRRRRSSRADCCRGDGGSARGRFGGLRGRRAGKS
jgi:hypothetical protein